MISRKHRIEAGALMKWARWLILTACLHAAALTLTAAQPVNQFSKTELGPQLTEFQKFHLDDMRKKGFPEPSIISAKETFQLMNNGVQMTNWAHWVEYYRARILISPIRFDLHEPFQPDFTTPENACRSYLRLHLIGDGKALLQNADRTGRERLRSYIKEGETRSSYNTLATNRLTRITVLLTASTILEGREYVVVCWRAEDALDPTKDAISLQRAFFVLRDDKYLFTDDMRDSGLAWLFSLARLQRQGFWKYPDYIKDLKASDLPLSFTRSPRHNHLWPLCCAHFPRASFLPLNNIPRR